MDQPPPLRPDCQGRQPKDQGGLPTAAKFFIGLIGGSILSGIVWPWWFKSATQSNHGYGVYLLIAVPAAKVVGSTICFYVPRWRAFGSGLTASIAVGFLIFFGTCAGQL